MVILLAAVVLVFFVLFNSGFFGGDDERIRVTCVGDSLTYGSGVIKTREMDSYPAQLQKKLGTSHLVTNYGVRNATASADGDVPYVESAPYKKSLDSKPDIVLLMLGTNDSKTYNWDAASYEEGIRSLVQTYKGLDTNPTVYLMLSPYCYALDGSDIAEYQVQPKLVAGEISDIVKKVAKEEGVDVIDLYSVTADKQERYRDGIHFDAEGYKIIADTIYNVIK